MNSQAIIINMVAMIKHQTYFEVSWQPRKNKKPKYSSYQKLGT